MSRSKNQRVDPIGWDPWEVNGVIIRWHDEVPPSFQACYDGEGKIIGVTRISLPLPVDPERPIRHITLNRLDYEVLLMSEKRNKQRIDRYKAKGKWFN